MNLNKSSEFWRATANNPVLSKSTSNCHQHLASIKNLVHKKLGEHFHQFATIAVTSTRRELSLRGYLRDAKLRLFWKIVLKRMQ